MYDSLVVLCSSRIPALLLRALAGNQRQPKHRCRYQYRRSCLFARAEKLFVRTSLIPDTNILLLRASTSGSRLKVSLSGRMRLAMRSRISRGMVRKDGAVIVQEGSNYGFPCRIKAPHLASVASTLAAVHPTIRQDTTYLLKLQQERIKQYE